MCLTVGQCQRCQTSLSSKFAQPETTPSAITGQAPSNLSGHATALPRLGQHRDDSILPAVRSVAMIAASRRDRDWAGVRWGEGRQWVGAVCERPIGCIVGTGWHQLTCAIRLLKINEKRKYALSCGVCSGMQLSLVGRYPYSVHGAHLF